MKIVSYIEGTAVVTYSVDDFRPERGLVIAEVIEKFAPLLNFQTAGLTENTNFPAFQEGFHVLDGEKVAIKSLEIRSDAIVVVTTRSDFSCRIAEFVLDVMCSDLSCGRPLKLNRIYRSSIVSEHTFNVIDALAPWEKLIKFITEHQGGAETFFGLRLGAMSNVNLKTDNFFSFERRVSGEFRDKRLFSTGPISTEDHINLLEIFDKSFG